MGNLLRYAVVCNLEVGLLQVVHHFTAFIPHRYRGIHQQRAYFERHGPLLDRRARLRGHRPFRGLRRQHHCQKRTQPQNRYPTPA